MRRKQKSITRNRFTSNVNRALRNAEDAVKGKKKERTESEKLQNVIFSLEKTL